MTIDPPDLPDDFDAELAEALEDNHTIETTIHNARIVATYYNTLRSEDIEAEHAIELTCQWVGVMWGQG